MRFTWANMYPNEGFVSRNSVWSALAFVHLHVGLVSACLCSSGDRLRRRHVLKYTTQLSCIGWSTLRRILLTLFCTKLPWSVVTLVGNRSSFMPITPLQHSYCTFLIIRFTPFRRLFINLTIYEWALFPKPTTTLGLVEHAFWRMPFFTKWVILSSSEVILARPSRHSTTGTSLWNFWFTKYFSHSACMK